jgi:molecular chaperone DnaJ
MTKDLYEVLGVDKTASQTEIKKGYRAKAKEYHPDKNQGDKEAESNFKDVAYAYEILSDENKKEMYDTRGHAGLNNQGPQRPQGFDPFDLFSQMFNQHNRPQQVNYDINVGVTISVEEAYNGITKKFQYNRQINCDPCKGSGGTNPSQCSNCRGAGKITSIAHGRLTINTCGVCRGKGITFDNTCSTCHGAGNSKIREDISIDIPPSVTEIITKRGKGNMTPSGTSGNLNIRVNVQPNDKFQFTHDYSLISGFKVPYEILMTGGKLDFQTIDGGKVKLTIKKLSKIGSKLKVKGKGMKKPHLGDARGDQFLILDIDIPNSINKEEEELLEKIKILKQ